MADIALNTLRAMLPHGASVSAALAGGQGGQGTVFRGSFNGTDAAIKVFRTDADPRRIDREIELLSTLACPHVVRLLHHLQAAVDAEPVRILVYEFHTGGDLSQHLLPGASAVPAGELLQIGAQVAAAINTLWSKRIVHRDIKPANIVRAADGRYVLVDVGFARHLDRSDITIPGGAPGTRGFRSPEQAKGRRSLTLNSDIFSLGVTLYVLATKIHPFGAQDCVVQRPIDLRPLNARNDLPAGTATLIGQMLDYTPAKRPQDLAARFVVLGGNTCLP